LSAGQRQLLSLTRALVWNPSVLLLDEATAAIDGTSDAAVRAGLRMRVTREGMAVLTVAHRLTTAREADRVIVLEEGRIVEEGPPDQLVRQGGRFAALVDLGATITLRLEDLFYRHPQSPYVGRQFQGRIVRTILRGRTVYRDGKIVSNPIGRLVTPTREPFGNSGINQ